jgi:ubiquinone/menaquinone biosynthesis C-methylase UbiE
MTQKIIHKSENYESYSELIGDNQNEKTIPSYMLEKFPQGRFIDIGGGPDTAAVLMEKMTEKQELTLVDLEPYTFKILVTKHPELKKFLYKGEKKLLKLKLADATDLPFNDSIYNIVNASSVVHEINSYSGGIDGINQFFAESARILKPEGFLVYRDPTLEEDYDKIVTLTPKTQLSFAFHDFYLIQNNLQSAEMTSQLARELTRHYITFLKEVVPYAWIDRETKDGAFKKSAFKTFYQDAGLTYGFELLAMEGNIGELREKFINLVVEVLQGKDREENGLKRLFLRLKERFDTWCTKELKEKYTYLPYSQIAALARNTVVNKKVNGKIKKFFLEPISVEYFERPSYNHFLNTDFEITDDSGQKYNLNDSKTSIKFQLIPLNQ